MRVIQTRNVHTALPAAVKLLLQEGVREDTRNGPALVMPCPVMTVYRRPEERVMFWPERDANPFFHLFEALWMLAGRNDIAFPAKFNQNMASYSDDGVTQHGAYGHRWRQHFGFDQLAVIIAELKSNPSSRRVVLQMWSAKDDLGVDGADLPCNTQVYFRVRDHFLDITVCCRSNDIVWGAYGANAVHFSFLQEYVATALGLEAGFYYQLSNNWHGYLETVDKVRSLVTDETVQSPYDIGVVRRVGLGFKPDERNDFDLQLADFLEFPTHHPKNHFLREVARPLYIAWEARKNGQHALAASLVEHCNASDWRVACIEWLQRREEKRNAA